jgi:hypothetical protein
MRNSCITKEAKEIELRRKESKQRFPQAVESRIEE